MNYKNFGLYEPIIKSNKEINKYHSVAEHDVTVADGESIVDVNEIIIHEKWFDADDFTYNYDVCLLKTNDLGINGDTIDFACLPNQGEHVLPTFRLQI